MATDTTKKQREVDPATVEIIRNHLASAAEEMQTNVMNSAYSILWQDASDLSCGLVSRDAEIIAQAERAVPMHIATMINTVREAIERTGGYDSLSPGDVLIQNDPYAGNNHLPDFMMAQPVFGGDLLLGFSVVRGHWVDVGGSVPTSYTTEATEIIQEGLRVPPAKLYDDGERNEALVEVILANTRDREERVGDMNAQVSGVRRGVQRFEAIIEKYGPETVQSAIDIMLDNDENRMRKRIESLPNGSYSSTDYLDGVEVDADLIEINAEVRIDDDSVTVDFAGSDPQVRGGVNAPPSVTEAAAKYALKVAIDPSKPGTSGSYRTMSIEAPKGTVVNPEFPAPVVAGNHETSNRVFDVVIQSIGRIDPHMVFGGGEGTPSVLNYRGVESQKINYTITPGGMGACPARDGISAIRSGIGNTGVQPIEREETEYEFVHIEEFSLVEDSAGAGRFRGGASPRKVTKFEEETEILIVRDRCLTQPFGMAGGGAGESAQQILITSDGEEALPSRITRTIEGGSRVLFQSAGGGGFGDPTEREPEAVLNDVENGYVSLESAEEDYGVAIDPDTLELDEERTSELRD